jgi:hypothetical protein
MHVDFSYFMVQHPKMLKQKTHFTQDLKKGEYETHCFFLIHLMQLNPKYFKFRKDSLSVKYNFKKH